jgi:hypothetical protein
MEPANAICLYCQKPIKAGRMDKKFCDAKHKDAYYNNLKVNERKEIKKVDTILKKNRRILKNLFNPASERLISLQAFLKAGYNFEFHTHFIITKTKGNEFTFCYDYGYREVEKDRYKVIKSFT